VREPRTWVLRAFGAVTLASVTIVGLWWAKSAFTNSSAKRSATATAGQRAVAKSPPTDDPPSSRPGKVDLSGQDVDYLLEQYEIDDDGSIFETHAPDTAIPKLKPPQG
jgi:hypothetical protein